MNTMSKAAALEAAKLAVSHILVTLPAEETMQACILRLVYHGTFAKKMGKQAVADEIVAVAEEIEKLRGRITRLMENPPLPYPQADEPHLH